MQRVNLINTSQHFIILKNANHVNVQHERDSLNKLGCIDRRTLKYYKNYVMVRKMFIIFSINLACKALSTVWTVSCESRDTYRKTKIRKDLVIFSSKGGTWGYIFSLLWLCIFCKISITDICLFINKTVNAFIK